MPPFSSRQTGFSIISLMVGLLISMLVLLATLVLFKNAIGTSLSSKEDSSADNTRMSSVSAAQMLIQGAGYKLSSAAFGTDLVVLTGAALNSGALTGMNAGLNAEGNAIVWGFNNGAAYQCEGLLAPTSTNPFGTDQTGGLIHLSAQNCTSALASATTLTWSTSILDDSPRSTTTMLAAKPAGGCSPFGIVGNGVLTLRFRTTTTRLTHSINNYNQTSSAGSQVYDATSCLSNFAS